METQGVQKVYEKICPHCSRKFAYLSEKQLEYNFYSHLTACENKSEGVKEVKK